MNIYYWIIVGGFVVWGLYELYVTYKSKKATRELNNVLMEALKKSREEFTKKTLVNKEKKTTKRTTKRVK